LFSPAPYVRFQQYNYHHWEEAPPRLVQHRLLDGLHALEAAPVITARPTADARYRLETHLARFERLVDGGRYAALIELHVRLVRIDAPDAPLVVGDFRAEEPAADSTMEATAMAFGRAMDDVVAQLAAGLANRGPGAAQ
ncbi:MAG: ABC-type transport auxiliary lipoprotein family protein, partial [Pseudomonadota bacterium]